MKRVSGSASTTKRRPLLHQMVQAQIKTHIIDQQLRPGDPLPSEAELAQRLEVSRTSVREAVKALEVLGIVEVRHGTGLFVKNFSFDPIFANLPYAVLSDVKEVTDFLEVRFHLEYGMAERIIESLAEEQLEHLRSILGHMEDFARQGKYSPADDRAFHAGLYQNVDNPILAMILDLFWELFRQARDRSALAEVADPLETYERHVGILQALETGDVGVLRSAIARHYIGLEKRLYAAGAPNAARLLSLTELRQRLSREELVGNSSSGLADKTTQGAIVDRQTLEQ
jgi:DNA-binding FadR family transcriptional regulator